LQVKGGQNCFSAGRPEQQPLEAQHFLSVNNATKVNDLRVFKNLLRDKGLVEGVEAGGLYVVGRELALGVPEHPGYLFVNVDAA
jgi:hypothetical protein